MDSTVFFFFSVKQLRLFYLNALGISQEVPVMQRDVLTVFMSMVMLVGEDVCWLSDVEQEFTEDDSWTRPVCCKIKS